MPFNNPLTENPNNIAKQSAEKCIAYRISLQNCVKRALSIKLSTRKTDLKYGYQQFENQTIRFNFSQTFTGVDPTNPLVPYASYTSNTKNPPPPPKHQHHIAVWIRHCLNISNNTRVLTESRLNIIIRQSLEVRWREETLG